MSSPTTSPLEIQKDCMQCPIRHRAVCARCEPRELARLEQIKYYRTYERGQNVVFAGDRMDFVASVVSGMATLRDIDEEGRSQMLGMLFPSDFLGRPGRAVAPYDVKAQTDLTLCCFRRKPFEKLMEEMPHIGQRLLEMSLDELDAAREWMLILGRKNARERIASLLLAIAKRADDLGYASSSDALSFDLPLTREAMADYLALTLETVSRQVSALRRDRVIDVSNNRKIVIPNLKDLIRETGDMSGSGIYT